MEMIESLLEKKNKLAVIGLGYVGLPLALEFAKKSLLVFILMRVELNR